MGESIPVRVTGGPLDGFTVPAEVPFGLHVPVADDGGGTSTAAYRHAGRGADGIPVYEFDGQWCTLSPDVPGDDEPAPAPLDPELAAYLDYPLYFHDDGVSCNKPVCPCYGTDVGPWFIWTRRRQTVRELLAQVKRHAEQAREA